MNEPGTAGEAIAQARRKQRRDAVVLIIVSSVFVGIGVFLLALTGSIVGVFIMTFFAAGIIAGAMQLSGAHTRRGQLLAIVGACVLALACALLIVLTLAGITVNAPGRSQSVAAAAAGIGFVFFGGGSIVLIRRYAAGRRM